MLTRNINSLLVYCARNSKKIMIATLLFAAIFPFTTKNPYTMRLATLSLLNVMLTLGLNFITGYLGQMSFGHAGFFGIGAYVAAILSTKYSIGSELIFLLAPVVAGSFGFVLGLPALKLRGYYLTIVTLGFCEIIRLVELNWMSLTRGPLGIMRIPSPSFFGFKVDSPMGFYFTILALVVLTIYVVKALINSRIGLAILAIREDDLAAEAMGVNVVKYKVMTFTISAMIAGLAGAFFAQYTSYVDPTMFTSSSSIEMAVMVIFGGLGSMVGSVIGATVLTLIPELLRGLMNYRVFIYGFIMVVLMLVKPEGMFGNISFKHLLETNGSGKVNKAQDGLH